MAQILGSLRAFLVAMPILRSFTDAILAFINAHSAQGWDQQASIPETLKQEVRDLNSLTQNWPGRPFLAKPQMTLHSDSSNFGWAGLNLTTRQAIHDFWRDDKSHINQKELRAAVKTAMAFGQPNSTVALGVDNSVTFWYLLRGGKVTTPQLPAPAISPALHGEKHPVAAILAKIGRGSGRQSIPLGLRQRRLHTEPKSDLAPHFSFSRKHGLSSTRSGYVCLTEQRSAGQVCQQVASCRGLLGGCSPVSLAHLHKHICQSTLDSDHSVAVTAKSQSTRQLPPSDALLGFSTMVSPVAKNAKAKFPGLFDSPISGPLHQLPGAVYASAKVASPLHMAFRSLLEKKEVPSPQIEHLVASLKGISRYDSAFKLLWATCQFHGLDPLSITTLQLASKIAFLARISLSQARNAYSAVLLLGEWPTLPLSPVLRPFKRLWQHSAPKYAAFWDAQPLV